MTENQFAAFRGFSHPMEVVDRTEMPYERRLAVLQDWQATLASTSATDECGKTILGAIHALEMGAEVQDDKPAGSPDGSGYGAGNSVED